jgi:hypothetical protein
MPYANPADKIARQRERRAERVSRLQGLQGLQTSYKPPSDGVPALYNPAPVVNYDHAQWNKTRRLDPWTDVNPVIGFNQFVTDQITGAIAAKASAMGFEVGVMAERQRVAEATETETKSDEDLWWAFGIGVGVALIGLGVWSVWKGRPPAPPKPSWT